MRYDFRSTMRTVAILLAALFPFSAKAHGEDAIRLGIVPKSQGRYVTTGANFNRPGGKLNTITLAYRVEGSGRQPRAQFYLRWDDDSRARVDALRRRLSQDETGKSGHWQSRTKKVEVVVDLQYGAELREFETLAQDIVRRLEPRAGPWPVLFTRVSFPVLCS